MKIRLTYILYLFLTSLNTTGQTATKKISSNSPVQHSFVTPKYTELPIASIKPSGWLLNQLQIMRQGSTGHLDEVYEKVRNDNGWLGGKGDGWEETPYWLDGALPLAYLLNDETLKKKIAQYVNWTLNNQRPSGYFGPLTKWERETGLQITADNCAQAEDWWPKMVMLKVLQQYYLATNDERVIQFMTRYFQYQLRSLGKCPVGKWSEWSESRGADNALIAQWLFSINKDKSLLTLCNKLQEQSFQWSHLLGNRDWVISAAAHQSNHNWMNRHGVNVAMGLKDPIVQYQRTKDKKYLTDLYTGFNDLMTLHGLPNGMFSADEDLHGNSPTQGVELCAIVEAMYSLEQITSVLGDPKFMDALERIAFNALPTQTTDDYNYRQYFQVANQVAIQRGVFNFSLPFEREMNNVLGMRSGYTCCLANMHQGWAKFATHLWYKTNDNGLAALHFSPSSVSSKVGTSQTEVTIKQDTDYPFNDIVNFEIQTAKSVFFPLHIRIPAWCREASILINGKEAQREKGGQIIILKRKWSDGDKVTIRLPMEVTTSNWGSNSRAIERGPLVYALKLNEEWQKGTDEKEGDFFSVHTNQAWNYGLLDTIIKAPASTVTVSIVKPVKNDFVWNISNAPIELTVKVKKIPDWIAVNNVAAQPVTARDGLYMGKVNNEVEEVLLIPYGCTKVRIVAFPVVK